MKKFKHFVLGGIEHKLFNLILIAMILVAVAFIAVSAYQTNTLSELSARTNERQQNSISAITSSVMDTVVNENLDRTAGLQALIIDEFFSSLGVRVQMLGEYAGMLFSDDPDHVVPAEYAGPDRNKDGQVTAQLIVADGVDAAAPEIAKKIGIAANMSDTMVSLFSASEATNSCFIALPEGVFLVADDRPGAKFTPDGTPINYDPRTRDWYKKAISEGAMIYTDVEADAFTGDIGIVCAMPIYVDGRLAAVVGSDLFLTSMQAGVQASYRNGEYVCIINQNGHVVFSPLTEGVFKVMDLSVTPDLRASENRDLAALVSDAMKAQTDVRIVNMEDGPYYMVGSPMKSVGWALIAAVSEATAAKPITMLNDSYEQIQAEAVSTYREKSGHSRTIITVLLAALLLLVSTGTILFGKRIVKPLDTITQRISELSEENLEFKMEDTYRTGDEIQVLAESFAMISHKTVEYVGQVQRVTAEKERISTELHMANQIQESMLPSIFPAFPERKEFDIYATMAPAKEVGGDFYDFFLIDKDHLCIVIADVSGKGVPAALFMMASKIILQSCAMLGSSPAEILVKTNEAICSNNRMEMFVTVWLGILEISTGKLVAANAGHEYPALLKDGRFDLLRDKHGFVIGGLRKVRYKEYTIQLQPGDKLFLYTDGLAEATDSHEELFGTDRMLTALNQLPGGTPYDIINNMNKHVDQFVGSAEQFDDLTMLCMEYKGPVGIDKAGNN